MTTTPVATNCQNEGALSKLRPFRIPPSVTAPIGSAAPMRATRMNLATAEHAGNRIDRYFHAIDIDAGETGRLLVAAHGYDLLAQRREPHQQKRRHRDRQRDQHGVGAPKTEPAKVERNALSMP